MALEPVCTAVVTTAVLVVASLVPRRRRPKRQRHGTARAMMMEQHTS